jgi:hypothetical protein
MTFRTVAAALAVLLGAVSVASAQSSSNSLLDLTSGAQHDQNKKPFSELEMEKIRAALVAKGFTAPTVLQRDGDGFLAVAWKNTDPYDVWVDPQSGVIASRRR